MEPQQLSQELRKGQNPHMSRRRAIIGLSMLGGSMGQLVTLYQPGLLVTYPILPDKSFLMQTALTHLTTLTTNLTRPMAR
jgi:hypothetical protein